MLGLKAPTAISLLLTLLFAAPEAEGNGPPTTDRVVASFGLTQVVATSERTCTGGDGEYSERHDEFQGDITSTDPRITGRLSVKSDMLINLDKGIGTGHGKWEIRDAITGDLKLTGSFQGVVVELNRFKALATANFTPGGGRIVANISIILTPTGAFGNIGSPLTGVESDPAVIQEGSCSGGFGP